MKNLEVTKQIEVMENEFNTSTVGAVEFGDVVVYKEMEDNTSVKMNLLEQIHAQLNQLDEMNSKRQFMMREILQLVVE